MLFAIALGAIVGGAAVMLVQQWMRGTLSVSDRPSVALPAERFPHLAPSSRLRRAA
jgi:hypothetical protein